MHNVQPLLSSRTLDSNSSDRVLRVLRTPFVLLLSSADSVPTVILVVIRSSRSFTLHTYLLSLFCRLCFHGDSCDKVLTVLRIAISPDTIHYVLLFLTSSFATLFSLFLENVSFLISPTVLNNSYSFVLLSPKEYYPLPCRFY